MFNMRIDEARLMNDLINGAKELLRDCAEQFQRYVEEELPRNDTTAPDAWKQEIIDNIDIQNIAVTGSVVSADLGLFYTELYQRVRAGVIDQGMKGVPMHEPNKIVWSNGPKSGDHLIPPLRPTKSKDAAYEIPQFYHEGTDFWANAVRRLETYFDLRFEFFQEDFNLEDYIIMT